MSRFVAVDLAGLEVPNVIEVLDYETILTESIEYAVAALRADGVPYDVEALESDPVVKVIEALAYRETIIRARINADLKAILLAYAQGSDLEHRAAFYSVARMAGELDEPMRERTQLAIEALATTGPPGAYRFHARTVDPTIRDVNPRRTTVVEDGERHVQVVLTFLTSSGDGVPDAALIDKVRERLFEEDIKPLTDELSVVAPTITGYTVDVGLTLANGPDKATVIATALAAVQAYCASRHRIGYTVYRNGIVAAAKVAGVENVTVNSPATDIIPDPDGAAYATAVVVAEA